MLYKVKLYETSDMVMDSSYVGDIIVDKGIFNVVEPVTGQKINIMSSNEDCFSHSNKIKKDIDKYGFALYIRENQFTKKNEATKEELSYYLDQYENSYYKNLYEEMLNCEQIIKEEKRRR